MTGELRAAATAIITHRRAKEWMGSLRVAVDARPPKSLLSAHNGWIMPVSRGYRCSPPGAKSKWAGLLCDKLAGRKPLGDRTVRIGRPLLATTVLGLFFGCGDAEVRTPSLTNSTVGEEQAGLVRLDGPEHTAIDPSEADWRVILRSTNLEILNVMSLQSPDSVSDRHFQSIGDLRNLKTLVIGSHSVTDKTLNYIGTHPRLQAVVLYKCPVTDVGLLKLSTAIDLTTVGLAQTDVTEAGIRDARREMPSVHFEVYDGKHYGEVFDDSACLNSRFLEKHWWPLRSAQPQ